MKYVTGKKVQTQQGFTLIELVIVIVILGILAATAAPKFIDLQIEAKNSSLKALQGAVESQSSIVFAKSVVNNVESDLSNELDLNGEKYGTAYGYPIFNDNNGKLGLNNLVQRGDGYSFVLLPNTTATHIVFYRNTDTQPTALTGAGSECSVSFTNSTGAGSRPVVTFNECT